jgi:putative endonuclease
MKLSLTNSRSRKGQTAENIARDHLIKNGLRFIESNFHSRYGEIDLIMQHLNTLVFIEVRYRKDLNYGGALESITPNKQQKICKTALFYMQKKGKEFNTRFDVVALTGKDINNSDKLSIEWIQNAF